MSSFLIIPFDDIQLFCNKNNISFRTKEQAYHLTWQHINKHPNCFIPVSIYDWITAYNFANVKLDVIKLSEIDNISTNIFNTNDRGRIVRILGYLNKLDNDLIFFCEDIIGNIYSFLKYNDILLMKSVCKRFNLFYKNNQTKLYGLLFNELSHKYVKLSSTDTFSRMELLHKMLHYRKFNKISSEGDVYGNFKISTLFIDKNGKLVNLSINPIIIESLQKYNFVDIIKNGKNVYLLDDNKIIYRYENKNVYKIYEGSIKLLEHHDNLLFITNNCEILMITNDDILVLKDVINTSANKYSTMYLYKNGQISLLNSVISNINAIGILLGEDFSLVLTNNHKVFSFRHKDLNKFFLKDGIKQLFKDRFINNIYMLSYDGILYIIHSYNNYYILTDSLKNFKIKRIIGDTRTSLILDINDKIMYYDPKVPSLSPVEF